MSTTRSLPSSLRLLRQCLLLGFFLTPVMAVGQNFFERQLGLAEEGDAVAQYSIGLMYMAGQNVPVNDLEAFKWYRLAADQGHADASATNCTWE